MFIHYLHKLLFCISKLNKLRGCFYIENKQVYEEFFILIKLITHFKLIVTVITILGYSHITVDVFMNSFFLFRVDFLDIIHKIPSHTSILSFLERACCSYFRYESKIRTASSPFSRKGRDFLSTRVNYSSPHTMKISSKITKLWEDPSFKICRKAHICLIHKIHKQHVGFYTYR